MIGAVMAVGGALVGAATGLDTFRIDIRRRWTKKVDLPPVTAYVACQHHRVGDDIEVAIHAVAPGRLTVRRLGSADGTDVTPLAGAAFAAQPRSGDYDFWRGFDWPTVTIPTSDSWRSGLYLLELTLDNDRQATYRQCIVLSPRTPPPVSVVLSTNTWAAYNQFGGLSNYGDTATPLVLRLVKKFLKVMNWHVVVGARRNIPATPLPFFRPNDRVDLDLADLDADAVDDPSHLVRAEWAMLRALDDMGIDYGCYTDWDIAYSADLYRSPLMLFGAHAEYWSSEMMGRFLDYVGRGGRALFLSGNNWYRTVTFLEHGLDVTDDRVSAQAISKHLGVGYTADGYETYAPFRVVDPEHPLLDGLGFDVGTVFAGPDAQGRGGSGYETDKVTEASGQVTVLAVGENPEGPAFLVWKAYPQGGWICNFGSVAIAPWVEKCDRLASIVERAIELGLTDSSLRPTHALKA